jgi:hypothetical protein
MACSKYSLTNTGTTLTNFNYRRCDDTMWQYQVSLEPNQTKNIWLIDDTYSTSFVTGIVLTNEGVFPPVNVTPTSSGIPVTPTTTPTNTPTVTQTPSVSATIGLTPTATQTTTPTPTTTPTNTPTVTQTPSASATIGLTPTATETTTPTPTVTQTNTPTNTETPTNTTTNTETTTPTPTETPTSTVTETPTNTPTNTETPTPTNTITPTNTETPTNTPTPSVTNTQTPTNTITPTLTQTPTPTDLSAITTYTISGCSSSNVIVADLGPGFIVPGDVNYYTFTGATPSGCYSVIGKINAPIDDAFTASFGYGGCNDCEISNITPTPTSTTTETPTNTPTNTETPTETPTPTNTTTPTTTPTPSVTNTETPTVTPTPTTTFVPTFSVVNFNSNSVNVVELSAQTGSFTVINGSYPVSNGNSLNGTHTDLLSGDTISLITSGGTTFNWNLTVNSATYDQASGVSSGASVLIPITTGITSTNIVQITIT